MVGYIVKLDQKGQASIRVFGLILAITGALLFVNEFTKIINETPLNETRLIIGVLLIGLGVLFGR